MKSDLLHVVLKCAPEIVPRARYVFDTLLMAAGIPTVYAESAPSEGPFVLYSTGHPGDDDRARRVFVMHCPAAWQVFRDGRDAVSVSHAAGLPIVLGESTTAPAQPQLIPFDIVANAFYFLSSWSERNMGAASSLRRLHATSVFTRLGLPQDIVDLYLGCMTTAIAEVWNNLGIPKPSNVGWPSNATYAVVLSHDVDFIPRGAIDNVVQGVKTVFRHLVRQRDPLDAFRSAREFVGAVLTGRDPYGCVPEIVAREIALGVKSSFQVAVGRRHADDVTYRIEDDAIRDYLQVIPRKGFDLCLHGSCRSTEDPSWYGQEVDLLARRLVRPIGSRQHYLSFEYDALFAAQERAGIQYDMSMGYPDQVGPRAGFSYPYFPYCVDADRPYDVLQISLVLMDVTLRSYMQLKGEQAWLAIKGQIDSLQRKSGCASVVWHPIVFGGARDPGFGELYWRLVEHVQRSGGVATDGRTINSFWRERSRNYSSLPRGDG